MALPILLVPGLLCTARLYAEQIPALGRLGPVIVADHTRDDSMAAIAERILAAAPPRFALAGLSMGGYVAFEIVRRAPERAARLALLSTTARLDPPEITERRRGQIALAQEGRFGAVADMQFPLLVDRSRLDDEGLQTLVRLMADETGAEAFVRGRRRSSAGPTRAPTSRASPARRSSSSATATSSSRRRTLSRSLTASPARAW